jgi:hypothetical protein
MTAIEAILYPHTEGGWPLCSGCFRQHGDVAHAIDPRTGTLDLLCGDCYRTLAAGQTPPLPFSDELERVWRRLARLHQNHEISDEVVALAFISLAPLWMPPEQAWDAFEALKHELLELQAAENGEVDLNTLDPQWRDAEVYTNHLAGLVDDAVHKLIGRA